MGDLVRFPLAPRRSREELEEFAHSMAALCEAEGIQSPMLPAAPVRLLRNAELYRLARKIAAMVESELQQS